MEKVSCEEGYSNRSGGEHNREWVCHNVETKLLLIQELVWDVRVVHGPNNVFVKEKENSKIL